MAVARMQALHPISRARLRPGACALLCALLAAPGSAFGQRLTGSVADATTREPITLALVALVDSAGAVLQQVLTNETGRFVMTPRGAGRVRLRIERIGYASAYEPFFDLDPDTARDFPILIHVQPITLEGITVSEERICAINAAASETLRVWTEARKALATASLAERQRLLRFSGVTFRRDVTEHGTISSQRTRPFMDGYRQPFVSLPAADLIENGYVRRSDGLSFFAPNAEVLLSSEFERSNCFSLTSNSAEPDLIGVRFGPNRHQVVPAIDGIVWLDARTARLRFVEFDYVNTAAIPHADLAGGRVEFQMLPNGGWLVSRWWIRMPTSVKVEGRTARALTFVDEGGEVRTAAAGGTVWSLLAAGTIAGVVFDSTTGRPLSDAGVALAGTVLSARTDANGHFRVSNLPGGTYALTLSHARLDSLPRYPAESHTVRVEPGDTTLVVLAIPPLERSALASCLATMVPEADRVAVYGAIRMQETGEPVPRARLRLSWDSSFRAARQLLGAANTLELEADERGRYIACDLPGRMTIQVELLASDRPPVRLDFHTGYATRSVNGRSILYRPLVMPRSDTSPSGPPPAHARAAQRTAVARPFCSDYTPAPAHARARLPEP